MLQHTDYVTAMAAAPHVGVLASAGLRGEAFLWDLIAAGQVITLFRGQSFRMMMPPLTFVYLVIDADTMSC